METTKASCNIKIYLSSVDNSNLLKYQSILPNNRKNCKKETLIGDILLYKALKDDGYNYNLDFWYNDYGKPYLKDKNSVYFNKSHSKDLVVVVIHQEEIGIDIEYNNLEKDNSRLMKRILNDNINEYTINKDFSFYEYWTIIESYLKYLGIGLKSINDIKDIKIDFIDNKISLKEYPIGYYSVIKYNDYFICVCSCEKLRKEKFVLYVEE